MTDALETMDATAQAELVSSGQASPTELVDAAIERAERLNPELNAIIHPLYDEARNAAAGKLPDGPFKGVPFALKDLGAALAGQPMHLGMEALKRADFRAPVDSYLGTRFRDAGFVTIGKTNCPELGILPTTEPDAYGATHNPWDLDRTPGGSSGGAAAAVASGILPIAHANDGGGSIRIPAACCGLVGLKPTRQRISEGPLIGDVMSGLTVELVVARSVRDVAAVLDEVQGPAPGDPYVAPPPLRPYRDELNAGAGKMRVGLMTDALGADIEIAHEVVEAARAAAELIGNLGHEVDTDVPMISQGGPFDPIETFMTRWYAGQTATLDQLGMVLGRALGPDDVEPLTWAMAEEGRKRHSGQYLSAVGIHQGIARMLEGWFASGHDLLLTPTLGELPPPLGTFDDSGENPLRAIERAQPMGVFTAVFNATGNPAISLPLAWSEEGLPIGIQLVAPFGREDLLIRIAAQLEQAQPWADRRPPHWAGAAQPA